MQKMRKWLILLFLSPGAMWGQIALSTEALDKLANDFWSWPARYAPFTADYVNRLDRPGGLRNRLTAAIDKRTRDLKEFDACYQKIDPSGWRIPQQKVMQLLAEARLQQGDKFNLRAFHDFVWKNGNVPIALQTWELLREEEPRK